MKGARKRDFVISELKAFKGQLPKVLACTTSRGGYPYDDIWEPVQRIIDAFGIDRCMWGTD